MGKLTAAIYKTNRDRQVLLQAGQQSLEAMTNANEALKNPAVQERLLALGVRAQGGTPQQLQALLASEVRHWGEVIRAAKIEPE